MQHCSCSQHRGGGTEVIGIGGDSSGSGDSGGATDNGGSDEVEGNLPENQPDAPALAAVTLGQTNYDSSLHYSQGDRLILVSAYKHRVW